MVRTPVAFLLSGRVSMTSGGARSFSAALRIRAGSSEDHLLTRARDALHHVAISTTLFGASCGPFSGEEALIEILALA